MDENDVFVRNLTDYPDKFRDSLYHAGGIGALRFGGTVWFMSPDESGGHVICYYEDSRQGLKKVELLKGLENNTFIDKLAGCAEQLFHVRFPPAMDIADVMLGAERIILTFYPPY